MRNEGGREFQKLQRKGCEMEEENICPKLREERSSRKNIKKNIALNHADFSGSNHPSFGLRFIWINNGEKRMRFKGKENEIPKGFIKGYKL